jgi:lysophospholipase L1-like esterase
VNRTAEHAASRLEIRDKSVARTLCSILQNLGLAAAVLLTSLVVADLLLPLFRPVTKTTLTFDPLLGLKGRSGVKTVWTRELNRPLMIDLNSFGFHDREYSVQKPVGTFRIVALGDSFVEAYQVPMDENFPKLLEQRLNQKLSAERKRSRDSKHIEILNQGIHGYGLGTYYLYVNRRLDAWSPDMLLLCMFLGNDLEDNYYPLASPAVPRFRLVDGKMDFVPTEYNSSTRVRDAILAHSNIAMLVRESGILNSKMFARLATGHSLVSTPDLRPLSHQQLIEMLTLARIQLISIKKHLDEQHVRLFILVIPDDYRVLGLVSPQLVPQGANYVTPQDRSSLERGLLDILETEKIPFEYPLDQFASEIRGGQEIYIQNGGHLTSAGHRKLADILEQTVWNMARQK